MVYHAIQPTADILSTERVTCDCREGGLYPGRQARASALAETEITITGEGIIQRVNWQTADERCLCLELFLIFPVCQVNAFFVLNCHLYYIVIYSYIYIIHILCSIYTLYYSDTYITIYSISYMPLYII